MNIRYILRSLLAIIGISLIVSCGFHVSTHDNSQPNDARNKSESLSGTTQGTTNMNSNVSTSNSPSNIQNPAAFFTYPYSQGAEIQPLMSGTLVMQEGCLLLDDGETVSVPVFPHEVTFWDAQNQILTANGVKIPLNSTLYTNGPLGNYEYDEDFDFNFAQEGDRECLKDRKILILGSQFMNIED